MPIISVTAGQTGLVGVLPSVSYINTSDTVAQVTTTGYLNKEVANGLQFSLPAIAAVATQVNPTTAPVVAWYQVIHSAPNWSLQGPIEGSIALPSAEIFVGNSLGVAAPVAMTGAVAITNAGVTSLVAPISMSGTTASATPGTIRAFVSIMNGTATTMTSGNIVGVRGAVQYVGASGGFVYGVQGKIIPTGTLSGSSWNAGLFGQLDISGATVNAGQMAPIWGDYGATSGTLTNQTGLYGIAMTNTTAAVLAGQLYLYGGATNLMLLSTNAGLSGVTYFKNAGVSAGSWGNATPPTPTKVLQISVDGVLYYLPLVAQNT